MNLGLNTAHCYCSALSIVMLPNRRVNAIETFAEVDFLVYEKQFLRAFLCASVQRTHTHLNLLVRYVGAHFSFYDFELAKHFLHIAFCFVSSAHCFGIFSHLYIYILQDFAALRSISVLTLFCSSLICLHGFFGLFLLTCFRTAF